MTSAAFGIGAYSVGEAAKLLQMRPVTLRRWLFGYHYHDARDSKFQPRLWNPQYDPDEDGPLLGFRDLVEARIVNALRKSRIGLPTIRTCIARAREILGDEHPFSTRAFKTDGQSIFLEITSGVDEPRLIDLKFRQHVFRAFVLPSLRGLEFGDDAAQRWWLLPDRQTIVADPERSFGQPIVFDEGVLTKSIADAFETEGTASKVAKLFEMPRSSVLDAVKFEKKLRSKELI